MGRLFRKARTRLWAARSAKAEHLPRRAIARRAAGPSHPELRYWLGIAVYWVGHEDHDARDDVWDALLADHPDSIWAHRIPQHLTGRRPDRH